MLTVTIIMDRNKKQILINFKSSSMKFDWKTSMRTTNEASMYEQLTRLSNSCGTTQRGTDFEFKYILDISILIIILILSREKSYVENNNSSQTYSEIFELISKKNTTNLAFMDRATLCRP